MTVFHSIMFQWRLLEQPDADFSLFNAPMALLEQPDADISLINVPMALIGTTR